MITLRNTFHGTETTIRAQVGDRITPAVVRRVHRDLCGSRTCLCGQDRVSQRGPGLAVSLVDDGRGGAIVEAAT